MMQPLANEIIARRLSKADIADYRAVRLHGLLHDPVAFSGCYAEESQMDETSFASRINESPELSAVFGAFPLAGGPMLATVALTIPTALKMRHKATLWGMYTMPIARGRGIGRLLMAHLIQYARHIAIERILLSVTAHNVASRWYEQEGFHLYGLERNAVKHGAVYDDDELRVRILTPS